MSVTERPWRKATAVRRQGDPGYRAEGRAAGKRDYVYMSHSE